jgi:predicted hydrocarbon binding protein
MKKKEFPLEREVDGARINMLIREKSRKRHGNRVIIFGAGTFVELQKESELILGPEASAVFYESGIKAGQEAGETMHKEFDERGEDLLQILDGIWGSDGLGWFRLVESEYDWEKKSGYLKVDDSFIATTYGRSGKTVCDFISGFIAGSMEHFFNVPMICTERNCWSNNANYCEFHFEPV